MNATSSTSSAAVAFYHHFPTATQICLNGTFDNSDQALLAEYGWDGDELAELGNCINRGEDPFELLMEQAIDGERPEVLSIVPENQLSVMQATLDSQLGIYLEILSYLNNVLDSNNLSEVDSENEIPDDSKQFQKEISNNDLPALRVRLIERDWDPQDMDELRQSKHLVQQLAIQAIEKGDLYVLQNIKPHELRDVMKDLRIIRTLIDPKVSAYESMEEAIEFRWIEFGS